MAPAPDSSCHRLVPARLRLALPVNLHSVDIRSLTLRYKQYSTHAWMRGRIAESLLADGIVDDNIAEAECPVCHEKLAMLMQKPFVRALRPPTPVADGLANRPGQAQVSNQGRKACLQQATLSH